MRFEIRQRHPRICSRNCRPRSRTAPSRAGSRRCAASPISSSTTRWIIPTSRSRVFDDVFQCLIEQIETSAKALLANRLAPIATAPPQTIRTLAFDDVIEVAGAGAVAIGAARRRRADRERAQQEPGASAGDLAAAGAERSGDRRAGGARQRRRGAERPSTIRAREFSERGFTELVTRAEGDDDLADLHRPAARHAAPSLSEADRQGLGLSVRGEARGRPSASSRTKCRARSRKRRSARGRRRRHDQADRDRARAGEIAARGRPARRASRSPAFAEQGKFDETNAALAALAGVAVETAENMMIESRTEGVMILAKVAGMQWSSVRAIIAMREKLSGGSTDRHADAARCLRGPAPIDRAAGAALPPHAAGHDAGGAEAGHAGYA